MHRPLPPLKGHVGPVLAVAFSPDGKTLASGGFDMMVKLWNVATGQEVASLEGHRNWIKSIAFSPDGALLATGDINGIVRLWRAVPQ